MSHLSATSAHCGLCSIKHSVCVSPVFNFLQTDGLCWGIMIWGLTIKLPVVIKAPQTPRAPVAETHQYGPSLFSLTACHFFFFFQHTAFTLIPLPMQQPFCCCCPEYQCIMFVQFIVCTRGANVCEYECICTQGLVCSWQIQARQLELNCVESHYHITTVIMS